jgi:hypothetical protein
MATQFYIEFFVQALVTNQYPDEITEKLFGVVVNDRANGGLGELIYQAYMEIYKRR